MRHLIPYGTPLLKSGIPYGPLDDNNATRAVDPALVEMWCQWIMERAAMDGLRPVDRATDCLGGGVWRRVGGFAGVSAMEVWTMEVCIWWRLTPTVPTPQ